MADFADEPTGDAALRDLFDRHDDPYIIERYRAGELEHLRTRLGPERWTRFDSAMRAGDLTAGRRYLLDAGLLVPTTATRVTTAHDPLVPIDPLSSDIDDPTVLVSPSGRMLPVAALRRERTTLAVVGVLIVAAVAAFLAWLLLRDDGKDTVVASDTSVATVVTETVATLPAGATETAPTGAVASTPLPSASAPAAAPTTATANAATTKPSATPVTPVRPDAVAVLGRSGTFGPYLSMVNAAGLADEVATLQPVTIFAPTESAFASLPPGVQMALRDPANRQQLVRIVRYNLVRQNLDLASLPNGAVQSGEGSLLTISRSGTTIKVNGATITGGDVQVPNGVVHAIDRLLVPPTVDLNTLVGSSTPASAGTSPAPVATSPATSVRPPAGATPPATTGGSATPTVAVTPAPTVAPATTSAPASTTSPSTTRQATTTAAPTTTARAATTIGA